MLKILILILAIWTIPANAKTIPKDYPIIIGCINQITWEIKKPLNQTFSACYHWTKWWKNLRFPSKKQFELMKQVYNTRAKIITAIVLINHESQFDSNAKWCHKFWCDYWIFQIRDINGGKWMTDKKQMEWFRYRKAWQLSTKGNCYNRVLEGNKENLLRCVFARHNGTLSWQSKYPTDRYEEWKFYNSITF